MIFLQFTVDNVGDVSWLFCSF